MANACGSHFVTKIENNTPVQYCQFCGSLPVEMAIHFLKQEGTKFSGSDWKYGWPHKFYIEPVNKDPQLEVLGIGSGDGTDSRLDWWSCFAHPSSNINNIKVLGDDPKTATLQIEKNPSCTCPIQPGVTGHYNRAIEIRHRSHLFLKFYNNHIKDATDEQFKEYAALSLKLFNIGWSRDEVGIKYSSPKSDSFYGFQRAGVVSAEGNPVYQL